ncbi:MAG TPA: Asp23/Gls24 family envelope stress response protein [Candidatus Limnocylindrales bacterium]
MRAPELVVTRAVVEDMVRLAAEEVPGVLRVGRGGPPWDSAFRGAAVRVRLEAGRATVHVVLIARPSHSLVTVSSQVRAAVTSACERLLGLDAASVSVLVDGVGG